MEVLPQLITFLDSRAQCANFGRPRLSGGFFRELDANDRVLSRLAGPFCWRCRSFADAAMFVPATVGNGRL